MVELQTIVTITSIILITYTILKGLSIIEYKSVSISDIIFKNKYLMWIVLAIHVGVLLLYIGKEVL